MQSKPEHLYEYAVVRFVPKVEREEFVNVGLVMVCKRRKWIRTAMVGDFSRIKSFAPLSPMGEEMLRMHLDAFAKIAQGQPPASQVADWPVEDRFRWLTAVRSSCIQTSRPHPGLTSDLDATFERLFSELVM